MLHVEEVLSPGTPDVHGEVSSVSETPNTVSYWAGLGGPLCQVGQHIQYNMVCGFVSLYYSGILSKTNVSSQSCIGNICQYKTPNEITADIFTFCERFFYQTPSVEMCTAAHSSV